MTATETAIAARPRTTLVSLLVIAFLCGAAAGAVGMRNYAFREAHHVIQVTEAHKATLDRWRTELALTDAQVNQLSVILDDFNKYYDNVLGEGHERILQVLTPAQRQKLQKMLEERY